MFKYYKLQRYHYMSKIIPFESEFILHSLTQKHLKDLFDLEFIASEIQLDKLRLDNLAFDGNTSSFVIIEYKNKFNANVLHQAQDYYDLILNNPEHFKKRLENNKNIDFENTRIMIIGPKFSDQQITEAKENFELWKVTLFNDGKVTYENLKNKDIKSLDINPDDLKLTEEILLKDKPQEICDLYLGLKEKLTTNFNDLELRVLIDAVSLRANNKLICKVNLKSSVKMFFYSDNINDSKNKLRNISDIATGDLSNWELKINSNDDIDYGFELFKQSYENINNQKIQVKK